MQARRRRRSGCRPGTRAGLPPTTGTARAGTKGLTHGPPAARSARCRTRRPASGVGPHRPRSRWLTTRLGTHGGRNRVLDRRLSRRVRPRGGEEHGVRVRLQRKKKKKRPGTIRKTNTRENAKRKELQPYLTSFPSVCEQITTRRGRGSIFSQLAYLRKCIVRPPMCSVVEVFLFFFSRDVLNGED